MDLATGKLRLRYELRGDTHPPLRFEERLSLGAPGAVHTAPRGEALRGAARLLALSAAPSYYKCAAPPSVVVHIPESASWAREYLTPLLREGLGEFAYRNQRSVRPQVMLCDCCTGGAPTPPRGLELPERALIAVGGGKDSCVSIDVLEHSSRELALFALGSHRAILDVCAQTSHPVWQVSRRLDPRLHVLNARGALNGHVPVTAAVSAAACAAALLHGASEVVFSNERSASSGNLRWDGIEVNHQYSKSLAFEEVFARALAAACGPEISYLSLLRPLSELAIARRFATLERFHPVFTSCNRAFRLDATKRMERWCCDCPKCRFVYLILAPWMAPGRLRDVLGCDLLAEPSQLEGFRELLGVSGHKPFECVGEVAECRAALHALAADERWSSHPLVEQLTAEIPTGSWPSSEEQTALLSIGSTHRVPPELLILLEEQ